MSTPEPYCVLHCINHAKHDEACNQFLRATGKRSKRCPVNPGGTK